MYSAKDIEQFSKKGLTPTDIDNQINCFKEGFPVLNIEKAATKNNGIKVLTDKQLCEKVDLYEKKSKKISKVKFVPASGAASRMFKDLFEVLNSYDGTGEHYLQIMANREFGSLYYFFQHIKKFGFFTDLCEAMEGNCGGFDEAVKKKDIVGVLNSLLTPAGLNYGNLPKGLLKFHKGLKKSKTPVEEHLIEGALYAASKKNVRIHFTVSENHMDLFKKHILEVISVYEEKYKVKYEVEFSVQQSNTDTIAVDIENNPFRNDGGEIVFRPGGHGALIQNLNTINADLVFIKNIDNVIQDRLKPDTILYKKALAGILLETQEDVFYWVKKLNGRRREKHIDDVVLFLKKKLNVILPESFQKLSSGKKIKTLIKKLNRPIRVCGMVRNEGEPGGGPFWVIDKDDYKTLQIVESSQFSEDKKVLMKKATHFNPVDLVCSFKDYKGEKFDLNKFVDEKTGFISEKSLQGKALKALELPGLWNGAMANWNTVFVEVPITTFSPVKTIYDLLKAEHLYDKDLLLVEDNERSVIE